MRNTIPFIVFWAAAGVLMLASCASESIQRAETLRAVGSQRPILATTPAPSDSAFQLYLDAVQAEGTLTAARATADFWNAQLTATEQAIRASATAQVHRERASATAYAQAAQATATERAWLSARETAAAQGTATAMAYHATLEAGAAIGTATAQAQATQGVIALQGTQQALAYLKTVDAASASALATSQAAQAELADLAADRERMMNRVIAATPWALGTLAVVVAALVLVWFVRAEIDRRQVISDENGNPAWWIPGGRKPTIIIPGRLTGPGASVENGKIRLPQMPPGQLQITTQAQLVEALRSIPPESTRGSGTTRKGLIQQLLERMTRPVPQIPAGEVIDIQIVDANDPEVRQWVADVEDQFVRSHLLQGRKP